ncbi:uncharacterized protein BYT42DRAFT_592548 [Radiomyces spectabilis]|uniref:uncharacterized protein n=1 Tax=Radiomyces spectabilis TaxID=64574 RepID=UPI00221FD133|nr:uncharacterized protein BYT42DRAFT_592548 [Radiomyces spectabilis]KAI8388843.1 hypothetical protein BYT42DRAFT_592548 [Radiomyces spectabilis]
MLLKKQILLLPSAVLCVAVFLQGAVARGAVEDITNWTKDQAAAYLDKYNIAYDKSSDDTSLLDTVKQYRDAAAYNAQIFGDKIDRLLDGLKIKLQKQYNLADNNLQGLMDALQHDLRQLELHNELTKERVKQSLDKLHHRVVKQKYVSEAQWKEIANDLESSFESQTWYQKFLGKQPTFSGQDDAYHTWLNSIANRLEKNKDLTKEQVQSVLDTVREGVTSISDVSKVGNPAWWKQIQSKLEHKAKLTEEQAKSVATSIGPDINAYKIFAMEYAGYTYDQSQQMLAIFMDKLKESGQLTQQKMNEIMKGVENSLRQLWPGGITDPTEHGAFATIKSAASSITADWDASSSSAAYSSSIESVKSAASSDFASATDVAGASITSAMSHAAQATNDWKSSFAHSWRDKERQAYKKIGYTEAHIDWIFNYLHKSFNDKKSFAKHNVDRVLNGIRDYLHSAKVQSSTQIEHQINHIEKMLEAFKTHLPYRDEL